MRTDRVPQVRRFGGFKITNGCPLCVAAGCRGDGNVTGLAVCGLKLVVVGGVFYWIDRPADDFEEAVIGRDRV